MRGVGGVIGWLGPAGPWSGGSLAGCWVVMGDLLGGGSGGLLGAWEADERKVFLAVWLAPGYTMGQ